MSVVRDLDAGLELLILIESFNLIDFLKFKKIFSFLAHVEKIRKLLSILIHNYHMWC